ncbi:uncharacterized protein BYT42DRAFT_574100 [Radiomyces spectabilis]|uniref:uncharacterized protein n=1 Tax=Radiomyces spectabilis TaxID=64574 RepID=UPI00221E8938|nr:uncharacterized protein BYT42DRAFT_574100 [Radiomyces spectabilis]KAI8376290.1 hypothetical protein BYT42DRAFT_574100 [Radiomyces spectabilis]
MSNPKCLQTPSVLLPNFKDDFDKEDVIHQEPRVAAETHDASAPSSPFHLVIERYMFFLGFLCPLAWFIGSSNLVGSQSPLESYLWKKRCRIAATLCLTAVIVIVAVVMVVKPSTFGLRTSNSSSAQTVSSSKDAVRPGVPVNGSNTWGDAVAGVTINSISGPPDLPSS